MARRIEWDGECIAILIEREDGSAYIAPPIVFDRDGNIVMGRHLLEAVKESGVTIQHPVIRDCSPGELAELDRRLVHTATELGIPIIGDW